MQSEKHMQIQRESVREFVEAGWLLWVILRQESEGDEKFPGEEHSIVLWARNSGSVSGDATIANLKIQVPS